MEILNLRLEEIKPYEKNPRNNDNAVDAVANSIREFGFKVPIIIDKDNVIVAGHTRYKASQKLGLKTVPCIKADDLNEEQIKAFRLADNKVSEQATWDFDLLNEELFDISMDMEQFGFIQDLDVDTGATNRKLGSDMADSVTGGGLHGKDLSKADVSINIYAFLKAQETQKPVSIYCAIGDELIEGRPYSDIVEVARKFINELGGFEKFAEWGLY